MGRPKDKVRELHFEASEGGKVKCKHCREEFAATTSATRLRAHIVKWEGLGIKVCTGLTQSNNFGSHKPNCNNDIEQTLLPSQDHCVSKTKKDKSKPIVRKIRKGLDLQIMKRYAFDCLSQKEREDLALELLNNDLNEEKQNLYDKARRHYAQVYKQDGNKRLRLDTSKEYFEDVERERKEKYDDFDKRGNGHDDLEKGKVIMEKGGRRRDEVWGGVTLVEGGWKCNDCGVKFAGGASRIKDHVNKVKGKGIRPCTGKANSNNDTEDNLQHSQGPPQSTSLKDQFIHSDRGQIQGDAKSPERIQVGSSSVSNWDTEDLQMLKYVFECLSPEEYVFQSPCSHLTQNEFITLKPGTWLNSLVIDIFVEILTESEKKKATPSNCYLPVMFSTAALKHDEHNFKYFVEKQKMKENYIFDQESLEKVFTPVHTGQETDGHFYLYIFYLNKNVIEIWDSLPDKKLVAATEHEETTKKLLFAMEILFAKEKGALSNCKLERANDIFSQDNGFDCGVFVIKYMQQSDNYVKRNPLFQFDSEKEREDLALKLLTNDLNQEKQKLYDKVNQEKQKLYDKARGGLYAQVETQDGNKRLRVDASKEHIEDFGIEMEAEYDEEEYDDSNEEDDDFANEYDDEEDDDDDSDEDDDYLKKGNSRYGGINTEDSKSITFRNMNLTDMSPAILPRNKNGLNIYGCYKDTGSLCNALSYGRRIELLHISNTNVKSLCCLSSHCLFCSSSQLVGRLKLFMSVDLKDFVSPDALLSWHQPSLFSHLTHLDIRQCRSMETLMTPKLLALFRNLRTILLINCWKMKDIIGEDDHSHPDPITIPKLTSLELEGMTELNFVYRGVMLCPSLQTFSANRCKELNLPRIKISLSCVLRMTKIKDGYQWKI